MEIVSLGDRQLKIKNYYCSEDGEYLLKSDKRLWLYVNITDVCEGLCPFCVNRGRKTGHTSFSQKLFHETLDIIKDHVYGISFTGGEPMLEHDVLNDVILTADEIMSGDVELDMVTNGMNIEKIPTLQALKTLTSIHLSRHGISDVDNQRLMGLCSPTLKQIRAVIKQMEDPWKVVFNCVLQKTGVSTIEDIADYLEMAAVEGISNVSFIGMFIANDYCKDNYVDPRGLNFDIDPRFRIWNHFKDYDYCSCSSGDYKAKNRWIRFYYRCPGNAVSNYCRQLVYTADNRLLDGFGGKQIKLL